MGYALNRNFIYKQDFNQYKFFNNSPMPLILFSLATNYLARLLLANIRQSRKEFFVKMFLVRAYPILFSLKSLPNKFQKSNCSAFPCLLYLLSTVRPQIRGLSVDDIPRELMRHRLFIMYKTSQNHLCQLCRGTVKHENTV